MTCMAIIEAGELKAKKIGTTYPRHEEPPLDDFLTH